MCDPHDPEIRALVATSDAETYTELADVIRQRFGEPRAWPVDLIAAVRLELCPPTSGQPSRFEADKAVYGFIGDRADLMSLDRLLAAGVAAFSRERFPSRSHLHRLVQAIRIDRRRALVAAEALPQGGAR